MNAGRFWLTQEQAGQRPDTAAALQCWLMQRIVPQAWSAKFYCECGQGFLTDDLRIEHDRFCVRADEDRYANATGRHQAHRTDSDARNSVMSSPTPEPDPDAQMTEASTSGADDYMVNPNSCEATGRPPWCLHDSTWSVLETGLKTENKQQ